MKKKNNSQGGREAQEINQKIQGRRDVGTDDVGSPKTQGGSRKTQAGSPGLNLDDYLGCFGNFSRANQVCKKFCAVNLRCAIERDQNFRIELIEDLVASEDIKGQVH